MIRKLLMVAAAIAMPVGIVAATGEVAGATTVVVTTNTATCGAVSGKLTFATHLTTTGHAVLPGKSFTEKTTVAATLTKCTTNKAGMVITKGAVTGSILTTTKNTGTTTIYAAQCASLLGAQPIKATLTTKWTLSPTTTTVAPTVSKFNQDQGGTTTIGTKTYGAFTLPGTGGITSSTGSFEGTDHGATNVTNARTTLTTGALLTACNKSTGLASVSVTTNANALPAATFA